MIALSVSSSVVCRFADRRRVFDESERDEVVECGTTEGDKNVARIRVVAPCRHGCGEFFGSSTTKSYSKGSGARVDNVKAKVVVVKGGS